MKHNLIPGRNSAIAAAYQGGASLERLAEEHHLSIRHIRLVLRAKGIDTPRKPQPPRPAPQL